MLNIKPDTEVSSAQAEADIDAYLALRAIPGYTPHKAENALAAARDAVMDARRALRNVMIGAKNEVRVIYGLNSNELASLGIKKKSDHARHASPVRKSAAAPDAG